ncbi:DNA-binding bromodomain-containing protein [Euphorbia peplus]|nr:DNA-binding bromodomain-containing protein [Euphorbia peplus]
MKRKRGRPKKAVAKKPTPTPASAPPPAPPSRVNPDDEEVFLNFVEKNVDENCVSNEVDDNGFDAAKEFSSSSSSSSSSDEDGGFRRIGEDDDDWSDELGNGRGVNRRGRPPMQWEGSKKAAATPVISLRGVASTAVSSKGVGSSAMSGKGKRSKVVSSNGFSSMSRKEFPKKLSDDPRYNKAELQACLGVIKKIMEMEEAVSFCSPVDPIAQGIPDYFSVIDTPMDFGTIYRNLQSDAKYMNSDDVYKDVEYIWENCSKYNKKGDYIVYLMKRVKKKFMKYWTATGLRTEMQKNHNGHSHLAPPSVHAMRQSRHEAMSVVDNMVNSYQMHHDKFGSNQPRSQARPSYAHPYQSHQPQPSINLMPQYSQMHAGAGSSYTGHSYMPGPPVHTMEPENQAYSHPIPPMMSAPAHSHQQQPQLSSRYMWNSHQTTSQPQPSQSHFRTDIINTGRQQLPPPTDYAGTHNGYVPRSSMDAMHNSMGQSQPQPQSQSQSQRHLMSHYQENESNQPQASMGPPQPSRPAASADISSPGGPLLDGSSRERRHMKRSITSPADEVHVVCALPQKALVEGQRKSPFATPERRRGGRGPTRCRFMSDLPEGQRIYVPINTLGQPIGPEASKLASFLGTLARDGKMAPLNYLDWSAMPESVKENLWKFVQTKFDIDPLCKNWFLKSIAAKWRNWKAKLKADHYNPHTTDEERLRDCNKRIYPDQWAALVAHWNDEAVQLRAMKNKANRAKQKSAHVSGSKSFARIREEEQAKRDGKELTRSELYILTRTRKDGLPVNDTAAEAIKKLREHEKRREQASDNNSSDQADTFCEVMGEETTHVRMYGCGGPTPADLYGRKPSRTSLMRVALEAKRSANEEVGKMMSKMEAMEEKYTSLEAQIAQMNSNMQILIEKMGSDTGSKQVPPNNAPPEDSLRAQVHSSSSSHALEEAEYEEES